MQLFVLAACGGGNPYGHSREYAPADGEDSYLEHAIDASYEDVRRDPDAYKKQLLGWFGVVRGVKRQANGRVTLALELRFHQPRHLCSDEFESSCRVTISEREGGPFTTTIQLKPDDAQGAERLNVGSLVKVYGSPNGDFDQRGGPVIVAQWYRQWPTGAYVMTLPNNESMRR
ncbi:MAG TPA: hypothetical protein VGI70_18110 [Polyangiales bacterium]|jgi:hypothetical protein